jgi:hypothetical protein
MVMVTTDKVYENREWAYGYREPDRLGGHDPYSANAGISRDELIVKLKSHNTDTRPVFPAISQYPVWPQKQYPQPSQAH